MTILLTTHLMDEADQLCQQVAFIVDGRLVANDAPRNLKLAHGRYELVVTLKEDVDSSHTMHDVKLPWKKSLLRLQAYRH
jgi:ABC-2 type transport system ATP-binding protein